MSFNNLKLKLLLKLILNYYLKNCSCQHYKCNCHHYKLLQINNIVRKRKIYYETRFHNPIRRTLDQQLKEKTTGNRKDFIRRKITNKDSILTERKPSKIKKTIPVKKSLVSQTSLLYLKKNQERIQETTKQTEKTSLRNRTLTKNPRILEWSQNLLNPQEIEKNS